MSPHCFQVVEFSQALLLSREQTCLLAMACAKKAKNPVLLVQIAECVPPPYFPPLQ